MAIVCLAKVSPLNPATGSRVDLYVSSAQDRAVTGLGGVVWEPAMTAAPTLSINLWQGDFREPVDTGGASFGIHMGILKMTYANADTYNWAGAPVEIYAEESGTAWPWAARFKGRIASYARRVEVLTINASIDTEPFDKDVLASTYAGTGGAEGSADLKGRLKPLIIGWAENVEPVLINTVDNVYQFSGYGAIEAVSVLYERAADFGASIGDYATYAALVAATIPAGRWATCLAAGMVRLGAPAAGVITGDIRGHKVSAATPRLTGAVINALATIAGVSSGNIETTTLTSLDSAVPYPINLVLTEQVKWRDMAAGLALACNWQSGITLTGQWFAAAVTLSGSEVITLNAQGAALPQVTTSDEADVSVPYYQTIFGADRCWRVQTSDEIAFTAELIPLGRYDDAVTYREGNIVDLADGSTWIYINAVASAGNDPPIWPTTSNSYWANRTPPTDAESIGAATPAQVAVVASAAADADAKAQDALDQIADLPTPTDGEDGLSAYLTNEAAQLPAYSNGSVTSYAGATGSFRVFAGSSDISASFALSTVANPQGLTIGYAGQTYTVTGGFDAGEDTATVTIRATGSGAYAGVTFDKVFSLSKAKGGYEIVSSLPATNLFEGRVVFLTIDDKLYRYTGSAWTSAVPASDLSGQIGAAQIAAGAIETAKFAAGIQPVTVVSAVPTVLSTNTVFNTSDRKLYRWNGTAYVASVAAGDVTGQITATQIADDAITTPKLAAGAVTADELASNSVVAGKIAAGAVAADQIAANAIRTQHLLVTPNNLNPDPQFRDLPSWWQDNESGTSGDGSLNDVAHGWYVEDNASNTGVAGTRYLTQWSGRSGNINTARYTIYARSDFNNCFQPSASQTYEFKAAVENATNQQCTVALQWVNPSDTAILRTDSMVWNAGEAAVKSVQVVPPSGAGFGRVVIYNQAGSTLSGAVRVSNITVREAAGATMVVDGAIVAGKLATNSVVADNISAGSITAAKLAASNVITLSAQIGDAVITNAKIGNLQVDTIKIANGAVTTAVSAFTGAQVLCPQNTLTTVQEVTLTATGAPLFIFFNGQFNNSGGYTDVEIYRGGSLVLDMICSASIQTFSAAVTDTPAAGTHTYYVKCTHNSAGSRGVSNRSFFILETKR